MRYLFIKKHCTSSDKWHPDIMTSDNWIFNHSQLQLTTCDWAFWRKSLDSSSSLQLTGVRAEFRLFLGHFDRVEIIVSLLGLADDVSTGCS